MNPVQHPIDQSILIGLLAGALLAVAAWRSHRPFKRILLAMVSICLLVPAVVLFIGRNPSLVDARLRTYQLFYWNLRIGMSRDEVSSTLNDWFPPDHDLQSPRILADTSTTLVFLMIQEDANMPASQRITLKMDGRRVVAKEFVSDR